MFDNKDLCGGHSDNSTNPDAPKTIESNELTSMSLAFNHSLKGRIEETISDTEYGFPEGQYHYAVKTNEAGQTILQKNQEEYPMSKVQLDMLAAVLRLNKVAEDNGVNRYTYGLPSDIPNYCFNAVFASGETIFSQSCPGMAGWIFPIAMFLDDYIAGLSKNNTATLVKGNLAWNCSCGMKKLRAKFCGECGAKSPVNPDGSWNCYCGTKNNLGKFCGNCGSKSPVVTEDNYS